MYLDITSKCHHELIKTKYLIIASVPQIIGLTFPVMKGCFFKKTVINLELSLQHCEALMQKVKKHEDPDSLR